LSIESKGEVTLAVLENGIYENRKTKVLKYNEYNESALKKE
jgi:hypothetical protein